MPYESLRYASQVATGTKEHDLDFSAWAEIVEDDGTALAHFEDVYLGHWGSVEEYAGQLIEDYG